VVHDALCLQARVRQDSSETNQARAMIVWINRAVTSAAIIRIRYLLMASRVKTCGSRYNTTQRPERECCG
jgi:hypothetical protein